MKINAGKLQHMAINLDFVLTAKDTNTAQLPV